LKVWLKQPLVDRNAINDRLDIVQSFAEDTQLREQIRDGMLRGEAQRRAS
jgi:DNA mismatch repair protein MSH2